jgi:hypothetical protein
MQLRVNADFLALLDSWRLQQPDAPSRTEGIQRLVEDGIAADVERTRRGRK